jgi:hypothetical protein
MLVHIGAVAVRYIAQKIYNTLQYSTHQKQTEINVHCMFQLQIFSEEVILHINFSYMDGTH